MLTLKVTAALQADPSLKDLTLTVDVGGGVATVGGEVPDDATIPAIRAAVGKVAGLAGVTVTCRVPVGDDPFLQRVRTRLDGKPAPTPEPIAALPPAVVPDRRVETHVAAFRPTDAPPSYKVAAEAVRAADARFTQLSLSFDAGVVVVAGRAASHADAMTLLQRLRQVPGVARVRRGSIDAAE